MRPADEEPQTRLSMVAASTLVDVMGYDVGREGSFPTAQSLADANDLGVGVLFDRLLEAVVIAKLNTGRIVLWNPAAEKLFGYTAAEAIGKSIEMLMPEPIAHLHRVGLERYVRTGHGLVIDAAAPVEMPALTKAGEEIRVELALSELQNSRGERFAVALIRDAMHRKRIELSNLELAQAHLARSEAEAALGERDELLDALEAAFASDPLLEERQRLARALADYRRLRHGELKLSLVDADLVDVVNAASDAARRRASGRRLLVHTPPTALAIFDPARTRQVLDHVLDEGMERTGDGARLQIRLEGPTPQVVQLTVRTEGSPDVRQPSVTLQLSRSLVRQQGGTFDVEVPSTGGLEVVMTLPASTRPRRPRITRPAQRAPIPRYFR